MTRDQIIAILRSFGFVVVIAFVGAFVIHPNLFVSGFWAWFTGLFIGQFILFFLTGAILDQVATTRFARTNALQAQAISQAVSQQSLPLDCAYCGTRNTVPVIVSQENVFKCFSCNQDNAVYMQFYAARRTTPVARRVETELAEKGLPDER